MQGERVQGQDDARQEVAWVGGPRVYALVTFQLFALVPNEPCGETFTA